MRFMVVGSRGMLGTDLMRVLAPHDPLGFDLPEIDIADARQCLARAEECHPDVIINAAALTNVDYCESHEEEALLINGKGTGNLAQAAHAVGALLVHYSTDYIFDGMSRSEYLEDDQPNPLSAYGRSKLRGEELARRHAPNHLILRTSWLFGRHGKNFIRTILGAAQEGQPLRVVDDQRGSPTYSLDLAEQTWTMVQAGCRGTYHVTNTGACTWYELACHAVEWAAIPEVIIEPVKTRQFPRPAPRPICSVLANARLLREGLPLMRSWEDAAREYVRQLRQ